MRVHPSMLVVLVLLSLTSACQDQLTDASLPIDAAKGGNKPPSTCQVPPTGSVLAIDPVDVEILVGATQQFAVTLEGSSVDACALKWSSSNLAVASVSSTGLVTAIAPGGPVTIKAQTVGKKPSQVTTTVAVVVPDVVTGLLGYYPFEGSADDASGVGRNGTPGGDATYTSAGAIGGGYRFSGAGWVDIGVLDLPHSFTLAAWMNIEPGPPLPYPFAVISNLNGTGYELLVVACREQNFETGAADYCDGLATDLLRMHTGLQPCCTVFNTLTDLSTPLFGTTWYYVAATFDYATGTGALYVNGQMVSSRAGMNSVGYPTTSTYIGKSGWNGNPFWGVLDEVRVYDRALTQEQIAYLASLRGS